MPPVVKLLGLIESHNRIQAICKFKGPLQVLRSCFACFLHGEDKVMVKDVEACLYYQPSRKNDLRWLQIEKGSPGMHN